MGRLIHGLAQTAEFPIHSFPCAILITKRPVRRDGVPGMVGQIAGKHELCIGVKLLLGHAQSGNGDEGREVFGPTHPCIFYWHAMQFNTTFGRTKL